MTERDHDSSGTGIEEGALDELLRAAYEREPRQAEFRVGPTKLSADRYRDFRVIGTGGMGVVFLAFDTELNRLVAVKVVRPPSPGADGELASATPFAVTPPSADSDQAAAYAELTNRFLQEAWLTGALEHPGIVPIYEMGTTPQGVPYYTMRYIKGVRTLETAISEAASVEERLDLLDPFLHVCDTIRYAHSVGVIHRDLKPANIGLGEFGEVVVLDWGLAKMRDERDASSAVWQDRIQSFRDARDMRTVATAMGTPGYMSPEAALGRLDQVDERSDVYSLAAMLYQILTGELPFEFDSYPDLVRKLRQEQPVPAASVSADVHRELSDICAKGLAFAPEDRYAGAGELAAAVREHQRESRMRSEIRGLMQLAEDAFDTVEDLEGDARVRRLDRVTSLCHRVIDRREGHTRARWLLEESERLREEAHRQRELKIEAKAEGERLAALANERRRQQVRLRRVGAAALLVLVAGAGVAAAMFDAQAREARAQEEAALSVLDDLGIARDELDTARERIQDERAARTQEKADLETAIAEARDEAREALEAEEQVLAKLTAEQEGREEEAKAARSTKAELEDASRSKEELLGQLERQREDLAQALARLEREKAARAKARREAKSAKEAEAASLAADDPELEDLRTLGERLREELREFERPPQPGWNDREAYAWKSHLRPRAPRMTGRIEALLREGGWVLSAGGERAAALHSSQWTRVVKELASLYTELDAAVQGYDRVTVSEKSEERARSQWDRRNPKPESIRETPSYAQLIQVEGAISGMRSNGQAVPRAWLARARELRDAVEGELSALQEVWAIDRTNAYEGIHRAAAGTRKALDDRRTSLEAMQGLVREWAATLQEVEERRLGEAIERLPDESLAEAQRLLRGMARGRAFARHFYGDSASRYGAMLRQTWAGPRRELLALLRKAPAVEKAGGDQDR